MKKIILLLVLLAILCLAVFQPVYYRGPASNHFNGRRFFNGGEIDSVGLFGLLKWKVMERDQPWPTSIENKKYPSPPSRVMDHHLKMTWLGHSSLLLQTEGTNILIDPVFSKRASPFSFIGPKRIRAPGVFFDALPKMDVILISHNHYDHLDVATLKKIDERDKPLILTGLGVNKQIPTTLKTEALDWWQFKKINKLKIYFVPAWHWSSRVGIDKDKTLWGGYVIETSRGAIYFAGDTAYGDGRFFKQIYNRFKNIKIAFLPIGSYEPRWFMRLKHTTPREAVQILKECHATFAIPIHYGTFRLSQESEQAPLTALNKALKETQMPAKKFKILNVGESLII